MSFYNMLFGMNHHADLLLAVLGLKKVDVERFRDVSVVTDIGNPKIRVYARTGGGNRADYPQKTLYKNPYFSSTEDDDFDNTYASFYFDIPQEFAADVVALGDIFENGLRKEFGQHLLKTINREKTEADKADEIYSDESRALARTRHNMMNGHTFVPYDDFAMDAALKIAEANGGKLRTAWGIFPGKIKVELGRVRYPGMKDERGAKMIDRLKFSTDWEVDEEYWSHCQEIFGSVYPLTMKKIAESVESHRAKKKDR